MITNMSPQKVAKTGILILIILSTLSKRDFHSYELKRLFRSIFKDSIICREATVYPILLYLEKHKQISSYDVKGSDGLIRTYYCLEKSGEKTLNILLKMFSSIHRCPDIF